MEGLEFLTDVVPKTTTYKQFKQKQTTGPAVQQDGSGLANGQTVLDAHMGATTDGTVEADPQATNGASHQIEVESMDVDDHGAEDQGDGRSIVQEEQAPQGRVVIDPEEDTRMAQA